MEYVKVNRKSFPYHKAHSVAQISISLAVRKTPAYTVRSYGTSASHGVSSYTLAFTSTQCTNYLSADSHPSKY